MAQNGVDSVKESHGKPCSGLGFSFSFETSLHTERAGLRKIEQENHNNLESQLTKKKLELFSSGDVFLIRLKDILLSVRTHTTDSANQTIPVCPPLNNINCAPTVFSANPVGSFKRILGGRIWLGMQNAYSTGMHYLGP